MSKRTYNEIKDSIPEIDSEKVKDYANELDRIVGLKILFNSDGGKELIKGLRDNCSILLGKLVLSARNEPTLSNLLSIIFEYAANIDILSRFQDISTEQEVRDLLDEIVKEEIKVN